MKNVIKKLVLFSAAFILLTALTGHLYAQVKDNRMYAYEYRTGHRVASALREKCSVVIGNVTKVNKGKVTFSIEERLLGDYPTQDTAELEYTRAIIGINSMLTEDSKWKTDEIKKGSKLMIFLRKIDERPKYNFITSSEKLFPAIRKAISHYIEYQQHPDILLQIPDLIKDETDLTFISYLVEFVGGGETMSQSNDTALVLNRLLESDKIPEFGTFTIVRSLAFLIDENSVFPITSATRSTVFRNAVKIGSSEKPIAAAAIAILEQIARRGGDDLRAYLRTNHKIRIRENLGKLQIPYETNEEKAALESLLTN